jgi:hypothetical protein
MQAPYQKDNDRDNERQSRYHRSRTQLRMAEGERLAEAVGC